MEAYMSLMAAAVAMEGGKDCQSLRTRWKLLMRSFMVREWCGSGVVIECWWGWRGIRVCKSWFRARFAGVDVRLAVWVRVLQVDRAVGFVVHILVRKGAMAHSAGRYDLPKISILQCSDNAM